MKKIVIYFFIGSIASILTFAQGNDPVIQGEKFDFLVHDLSGNFVKSNDKMFDEKVVYVTLWGTWCPPCISEIPTLIELQNQYQDSGLVIIAIAFEKQENDDLRKELLHKFINDHKIIYLVLDGGIPKNFETALPTTRNINGLPVEILINRRGEVEVIRNSYGYSEVWAGRLKHEIKTLLNLY